MTIATEMSRKHLTMLAEQMVSFLLIFIWRNYREIKKNYLRMIYSIKSSNEKTKWKFSFLNLMFLKWEAIFYFNSLVISMEMAICVNGLSDNQEEQVVPLGCITIYFIWILGARSPLLHLWQWSALNAGRKLTKARTISGYFSQYILPASGNMWCRDFRSSQ